MKSKPLNFMFLVIAIILGVSIYRQFDYENLTFKNNALAIVYIIVFIFSVIYLIQNNRKTD